MAPLTCYNCHTRERILIFFGTNVTNKVSNQKALYYATSNNLCFCTTWQNWETRKLPFSLKYCVSALPELNQLPDFFNLFDSQLILALPLYDSLNLVINAFSSGLLGAWFKISEVQSTAEAAWTVLHTQCTSALFSGLPISQGNAEALYR